MIKFYNEQMVLPNLTTNTYYEVKVRAASISTINPRQVILGSYSEPQEVSFLSIKIIEFHMNCYKPYLHDESFLLDSIFV